MASDTIPDPRSTQQQPQTRVAPSWFDRALLLATILTCAVALSPNPADPDLWGHVQYGRDALADGLPASTTYSYTAEGYRWINHENLAELLLAIGMDWLGPIGMLVAKCLLGVGVIGLIIRHGFRRGFGLLSVCVVALLVAVNLTYFWSMRPQVLTCVYYTLLIALLSYCFSGWEGTCRLPWLERSSTTSEPITYSSPRMRCLWWAPVLFFFWANSHGGFVAGYCIYVAYLAFRGIEAWACNGRAAFGLLRRLALMIVVAGLATCLNPYGPQLQLWLLASLGSPRPEILEWHPPDMTSTVMLPLWLIIFTWFAVLLLTRRSRDVTHLMILTVTLWQSLEHVRHIPFFAIPFGFWMAPHVDSVLRRFQIGEHAASFGEGMKPAIRWTFVTVTALAFLLLGYRLFDRLRDMPVARNQYPVSAFQFIADHDLQGRMIVTYNWAQYAIAAFGPRATGEPGILVSFDGRFRTCYPQQIVDMNFDFVLGELEPRFRGPTSPVFDDEWVLEYGRPDLVLLNRYQPHSVNVMFRNQDDWALLYQDKMAQLWGRRTKYDNPQSPQYIPAANRLVTDDQQEGTVTWLALPAGRPRGTALAAGTR